MLCITPPLSTIPRPRCRPHGKLVLRWSSSSGRRHVRSRRDGRPFQGRLQSRRLPRQSERQRGLQALAPRRRSGGRLCVAASRQVDQRRVNLLDPEASLILQKPTGQVVHQGGLRFKRDSLEYQHSSRLDRRRAPGPSRQAPGARAAGSRRPREAMLIEPVESGPDCRSSPISPTAPAAMSPRWPAMSRRIATSAVEPRWPRRARASSAKRRSSCAS